MKLVDLIFQHPVFTCIVLIIIFSGIEDAVKAYKPNAKCDCNCSSREVDE